MRRSGWSSPLSVLLCGTIVAASGGTAWGADEGPGGLGLAPPAGEPATGGEPQLPSTPENGIVRLTIKTDNPQVQLKRKVATVMTSATTGLLVEELVCRAPCGVVVDGRKGEEFYFGGKDFIPSEPFQLITQSGNLEATVEEGNHLAYTLGGGFLVLGIIGTLAGLLDAAISDVKWGLITAGASAGVGIVGGFFYLTAGQTKVEFRPGPAN